MAVNGRRIPQLPIAEATIVREYGLLAELLRFETNDPALLAAADAAFRRFALPDRADAGRPLVVRLFSETAPGIPALPGALDEPPATIAASPSAAPVIFRTQSNVLTISGPGFDVATVDLDAGTAVGFVRRETALDTAAVRYSFVEAMALSLLTRGRRYLPLHAAAVVRSGVGIVLRGPAGAGKSTLAMACARRAYRVCAEDTVFVRLRPEGVELWGLPWRHRLLPDAARFFPELRAVPVTLQPNGEQKIDVDVDAVYPGTAVASAPPGPIVLLARGTGGPTRLEPIDPEADEDALEILWPWDGGWSADHEAGLRHLATWPRYRLHMNGTPDAAVDVLDELVDRLAADEAPATPAATGRGQAR